MDVIIAPCVGWRSSGCWLTAIAVYAAADDGWSVRAQLPATVMLCIMHGGYDDVTPEARLLLRWQPGCL